MTACGVDDCNSNSLHHLLHGAKRAVVRRNTDSTLTVNHVRTARETTTMLSFVSITLEIPDTKVSVRTYGLIDKGAEPVLMKRDVADALKLNFQPAGFSLRHFDGTSVHRPRWCSISLAASAMRSRMFSSSPES